MRTLKFIVDGKSITKDPSCDFTGLFPENNPELRAEFIFSPEWKSRVKVVAFYSILGKEFPPQVINEEKHCQIPAEALKLPAFCMQILAIDGSSIVSSDPITIYQKGGKT